MADSTANLIAKAVLDQFDKLPAKRKPKVRDNGVHEWVPISGIVAEQEDGRMRCVSLATGMKCLPASKIPEADGVGLHDWHAEVVAIRKFNCFVLDECARMMNPGGASDYLERADPSLSSSHNPPFRFKAGIKLHMYTSEAPCGDASMELLMASQDDASPWEIPITTNNQDNQTSLPGRAHFSHLGIVRRKPSRADAPPTLSKSCTDKLSLHQCTSLLASLPSLLVLPAGGYLATLVLPRDQHSPAACLRAFSAHGRMKPLVDAGKLVGAQSSQQRPREEGNGGSGSGWGGGYAFRPFAVDTTTVQFEYSRQALRQRARAMVPSNLAATWSLTTATENQKDTSESLIGGVRQGHRQFHPSGASTTSRRALWTRCRRLALAGGWPAIVGQLAAPTYGEVKYGRLLSSESESSEKRNEDGGTELLRERARVKECVWAVALAGWVRNTGDEMFSLD